MDRAGVLVDPYIGRACHGRRADGIWFVVGVGRCQRRATTFLRFFSCNLCAIRTEVLELILDESALVSVGINIRYKLSGASHLACISCFMFTFLIFDLCGLGWRRPRLSQLPILTQPSITSLTFPPFL